MSEFSNKTIVITGSAGNLGSAVAKHFADLDADLALVDRSPEPAQTLAGQLAGNGKKQGYGADLTDGQACQALADQIQADFGHIHALINIAGGFTMGPLVHETEDKDWDFMMDLNGRTVFNMCRATVPHMLAGGGRIVNISARPALQAPARMAPYSASKGLVLSLTQALADEHLRDGINVNAVLPSIIDTPQNREAMPDATFDDWVKPESLADVIGFLVSAASRDISGAAIPVYGKS